MDLQTITHPDDRAETPQKMEELASGRISSFAQVKRYVRKDGGIIWVNITISPLWARGDPPDFAMASVEDITDRKRAEDALAISEERYRTLFESMRIGVLYFAPDDTIISANPTAVSMLGITQGEIMTRRPTESWWRNIHEDGSKFSAESLPSVQAIRTREAVHDVIIGIFNEHEQAYHWANVNAIPQFRAGQTSPYQVYVTMEDITERRAMGRQLAHLASFPAENPYPVLEVGTDGVVRFANAATTARLARLGLDPDVRQFLPGDAGQLERLRQQCEQYPQAEERVLGKATFDVVIMAPAEGETLRGA